MQTLVLGDAAERVASRYMLGTEIQAAFVSTNSITQGEQVARLWASLLSLGLSITFAHRTFAWSSEAKGKAHVHVVIVGFTMGATDGKHTIFDYPSLQGSPIARQVTRINPYLIEADDVLVESRTKTLSKSLSEVLYGNKPSDGGFLVIEPEDVPDASDPAFKYVRRYLGSQELLSGDARYCIWMAEPDSVAVKSSAFLRKRLEGVKRFREESTAADTRKFADRPWRFFRVPQPGSSYLAIPRVVSANRIWFTVKREPETTIASDSLFTALDTDGFVFAVLSSKMFVAWLGTVGGRLKSDYRFSGPMVYNTFPLPEPSETLRQTAIDCGSRILDARLAHGNTSLAELYEPLAMPIDLVRAHNELDKVIDALFEEGKSFESNEHRLQSLFAWYENLNRKAEAATMAQFRS